MAAFLQHSRRIPFVPGGRHEVSMIVASGLSLIILTVLTHVLGLSFIRGRAVRAINQIGQPHRPTVVFVTIVGTATLSATILHAGEASIWASAYDLLAERHNKLWAHECQSRRALAPYGSAGSS